VSLPAVILVGGFGTRLRPLTDRTRKDMLPLVDRPLLALDYRVEQGPLGTGGAVRFAADGLDEPFFAVNGDSLREADLAELERFHRAQGAKATILLTPVADPTRYGLVRLDGDGRVQTFLEKPRPEEIDTNLINAGVYVLEPEVLDLIPAGRSVSIEREVFPRLVEAGSCYGLALPGYWLDVGTPESYLQAHRDVLVANQHPDAQFVMVGDGCEVRGMSIVGPGARVGARNRLAPGVRVAAGAVIPDDSLQ